MSKEKQIEIKLAKAAELGNGQAMYSLAESYLWKGNLEKEDEIFNLLKAAADKGICEAYSELGFYYQCGIGTEEHKELAISWYTKAIEELEMRKSSTQDAVNSLDTEAIAELTLTYLQKGNAYIGLGNCYKKWNGSENDIALAVKSYQKALECFESIPLKDSIIDVSDLVDSCRNELELCYKDNMDDAEKR